MNVAGLVGVIALVGLLGAGEPAKPTVGFRLQDHRGAWHTLDEAARSKTRRPGLSRDRVPPGRDLCPEDWPRSHATSRSAESVFSGLTPIAAGRTGRDRSVRREARPVVSDPQGCGQRPGRPDRGRADPRGLRPGSGRDRSFTGAESTINTPSGSIGPRRQLDATWSTPSNRSPRRPTGDSDAEDRRGRLQDRSGLQAGQRRGAVTYTRGCRRDSAGPIAWPVIAPARSPRSP